MGFLKKYFDNVPESKGVISNEAIDIQKNDPFVQELYDLHRHYNEDHPSDKEFCKMLAGAIHRRFGFNCTVEMENVMNAGCYMYFLNDVSILNPIQYQFNVDWAKHNKKARKNIAKDLSTKKISNKAGLDYSKVKVSGLFTKLPLKFMIGRPMLKRLDAKAFAYIMLHEIGHGWTGFEFTAVTLYRNVIIENSVKEILGTKNENEKLEILLDYKNMWGLDVDPEALSKADNEDVAKVFIGSFSQEFAFDQGYVQYGNNNAEVLADQFAIRFGTIDGANNAFSGEWGDDQKAFVHELSSAITSNFIYTGIGSIMTVIGAIGLVTVTQPIILIATLSWATLALGSWIHWSGHGNVKNGWIYDEPKRRIERMYNEQVNFLKQRDLPKDELTVYLKSLKSLKATIDQYDTVGGIGLKVLEWVSSEYRSQKAKRIYQQLTEDLLANDLYVKSAYLKQLQ